MSKTVSPPLFDTATYLAEQSLAATITLPFAKQEFAIIKDFLLQYSGSQDTFNAYRRECERLTQWAWFKINKSVRELNRSDMENYIRFCQNPPVHWVGSKVVARFINHQGRRIPNPDWRLFVVSIKKADFKADQPPTPRPYQLSQKALQSIFIGVSTFYNHLIREGHCEANPITLIRQKSKFLRTHQGKRQIRRLTSLQWEYVIETAKQLAEQDPLKHERTLFMMSALYLLYLRISELAASARWMPQMGDFYQDSQGNWWFKTVGKGNKERDVSVGRAMLGALKRYRCHRGLTPSLPIPGDNEPLISKLLGQGPVTSTRQIRFSVQCCFDQTVSKMRTDGFTEEAASLQEATVHWLRHTGISDDINKRGRPIAHVRDDAGHASSATTDLYNDSELQARHASADGKDLLPD